MNNKQKIITLLIITLLIINVATVYLSSYSLDLLKNKIALLEDENDTSKTEDIDTLSVKQGMIVGAMSTFFINDLESNIYPDTIYDLLFDTLNDPYSHYLSNKDLAELMLEQTGELSGIGINIAPIDEGLMVVVKVIEGSPAHKAGIETGDTILKVDNKDYKGSKINDIITSIRGEIGSEVELLIKDKNGDEKLLNIERLPTEEAGIWYETIVDNIGYIRIASIECSSNEVFKEALEELIEVGAQGLILDARDSNAGALISGISMADEFIKDGILGQTIKKDESIDTFMANDYSIDLPVVLLVNKYSIGAVEVLAGALKDNNRAVIVGETTFGKGIEQQMIVFYDNTAMNISVYEHLTPNGMNIDGYGVEPDIEVVPIESEGLGPKYLETDNQLLIAIDELLKFK